MTDPTPGRGSAGRRARETVYSLGTVIASVVASLLVLEILARLLGLGSTVPQGESPFATFTNAAPVFQLGQDGKREIYTRTRYHWIPGPQSFRAEKDPRGIRIFGLGGSAAMGWPHPPQQSYLGMLEQKLRRMYPDREIEVLNVAGNTYASYRIKVVFDEVVGYDPDLVLIYCGNNEFLENFVYRTDALPSPWNASALARFVHGRLGSDEPKPVIDIKNYGTADKVSTRLSFAFGRTARLREDPAQLQQVVEHYRYNMDAMVAKARERNVPVMLLDVPVNLKDWTPNVSAHRPGMAPAELARFNEAFRRGLASLEASETASAIATLEGAVQIDDGYALAHYRLGQALHRAGRIDAARRAYVEALRADAYPFRSLPQFDDIRREIARRRGVPLVETVKALERAAVDGIAGLDVMVDYVHPTVAGNELIAHEVLRTMDAAGLLPEPRAVSVEETRIQVPPEIEETVAVLFALQSQYLIMRQYDQIGALSNRLLAAARLAASARPDQQLVSNIVQERVETIQRVIEPYRRLLRAEESGTLEQEFTREAAQAIYADYIELIRKLEAGKMRHEEFEGFVPALQYGQGAAGQP